MTTTVIASSNTSSFSTNWSMTNVRLDSSNTRKASTKKIMPPLSYNGCKCNKCSKYALNANAPFSVRILKNFTKNSSLLIGSQFGKGFNSRQACSALQF